MLIFSFFEDWDLFDSLYYTVGIVTIGDTELYPKNRITKVFSMIYMLMFSAFILYITSFLVGIFLKKNLL
jgi:hypothetical protein